MNDPFELLALSMKVPQYRTALRNLKAEVDGLWGALCFSRGWSDPLLWSHYADKHRGLCLGFDVPDKKVLRMSYDAQRLEVDIGHELSRQSGPVKLAWKLMSTKYRGWKYEREVRILVSLRDADPDTGMFFCNFGRRLQLKEVIVGARSDLSKKAIEAVLCPQDARVTIAKGRLAFGTFRVVRQRNSRLWN